MGAPSPVDDDVGGVGGVGGVVQPGAGGGVGMLLRMRNQRKATALPSRSHSSEGDDSTAAADAPSGGGVVTVAGPRSGHVMSPVLSRARGYLYEAVA
jgi:hypothetical protein